MVFIKKVFEMRAKRMLNEDEQALILHLCKKAGYEVTELPLRGSSLKEGEIGGVRISSLNTSDEGRQLGKNIADMMWNDLDGVRVMASLYIDADGELFELDVWKMDYSPIQSLSVWQETEVPAMAS